MYHVLQIIATALKDLEKRLRARLFHSLRFLGNAAGGCTVPALQYLMLARHAVDLDWMWAKADGKEWEMEGPLRLNNWWLACGYQMTPIQALGYALCVVRSKTEELRPSEAQRSRNESAGETDGEVDLMCFA
jgi:hypothetical protein